VNPYLWHVFGEYSVPDKRGTIDTFLASLGKRNSEDKRTGIVKGQVYFIVMLLASLVLAACGPTPTPTVVKEVVKETVVVERPVPQIVERLATATPVVPSLTLEALKNAEYQSEFPASRKARLTNGAYREKIVPGSATELVIILSDKFALGDLNGDGVEDAAVVLVSNPGGSGTFYDLAAVINQNGTPKHVASLLLGDRVKVKSLSIRSGEVAVEMTKHGPKDPMCCPTLEVTQKYKLQGDKLAP